MSVESFKKYLGYLLIERIVINSKVKFKVMRADITSDYDSTVNNIERRIKELGVKRFLTDNPQFSSNDICGIVHIVDLDGTFISDDLVIQGEVEDAQYYDDPRKFESFFNGSDIKIPGTYQETWNHIQIALNSLKRGSNFWICIANNKKNEAS